MKLGDTCVRSAEVRVRDWTRKMAAEEPAEWRQRICGSEFDLDMMERSGRQDEYGREVVLRRELDSEKAVSVAVVVNLVCGIGSGHVRS
jgi:hypothetical protein